MASEEAVIHLAYEELTRLSGLLSSEEFSRIKRVFTMIATRIHTMMRPHLLVCDEAVRRGAGLPFWWQGEDRQGMEAWGILTSHLIVFG